MTPPGAPDEPPPPRPALGPLALVGGSEWDDGCGFDVELLEASGTAEVLIMPTGAAYEYPERSIEAASRYFRALGVSTRPLMVLRRPDALDPAAVRAMREARFVYLNGGSPLHLRSVLKSSPLWDGLVAAWQEGAVVAGSSAGAMVLGDPMVDPRGGALTVGLGLIETLAVVPHADTWSPEKAHRTVSLATGGLRIAAIDERTALIRHPDGSWTSSGRGSVSV